MNDAYTKFMLQQDMSQAADAAFYEKLEKGSKKHRPVWKAAVAVACVLLMIPVSVWAAESIFGVTKVTVAERPMPINDLPHVGLDIVYENIEHYSLKDFPKHLQELEKGGIVLHDDWAAAEEYLGIDLIDNPFFTAEDTYRVAGFGKRDKFCQGIYYVWDGQFYGAKIGSLFKRDGFSYSVNAMITADAPSEITEEVTKYYHGHSISYAQYPNRDVTVSTEDYVSKAGIPVLIVAVTGQSDIENKKWDDLLDCFACFAVNNISYTVSISGYSFASTELDTFSGPKEKNTVALKEFLDGFVIE